MRTKLIVYSKLLLPPTQLLNEVCSPGLRRLIYLRGTLAIAHTHRMSHTSASTRTITLPTQLELNPGLWVTMREAGAVDLPDVYRFYTQHAFNQHHGVSIDDYSDEQDFTAHNSQPDHKTYMFERVDNGELMSLGQLFPSPFMRSVHTLYSGIYFIKHKEYKGVVKNAHGVLTQLSAQLGYAGNITRVTITNVPSFILSTRFGYMNTGIVPLGIQGAPGVYKDEVIMLQLYGRRGIREHGRTHQEIVGFETLFEKSIDQETLIKEDTVPAKFGEFLHGKVLKISGNFDKSITMSAGVKSERKRMEQIMQKCAKRGKLFGVDEFLPDGTHCRKMLRKSLTITATDQDGRCVGGMICGPTALARSPNSPMLGVYIILLPELTEDILTIQTLYSSAIELVVHNGLRGIITDILCSDTALIQAAMSAGMAIVGSVPNSAYVYNRGYTDNVVMCYKIPKYTSKL